MQASNFLKIQEITETVGCLDSHIKFLCNIRVLTFGHRPRISDGSSSEVGIFERLPYPVLKRFSSDFSLYPTCPEWTVCLLSATKVRAVLYPTGHLPRRQIPYGVSLMLKSLLRVEQCCQ